MSAGTTPRLPMFLTESVEFNIKFGNRRLTFSCARSTTMRQLREKILEKIQCNDPVRIDCGFDLSVLHQTIGYVLGTRFSVRVMLEKDALKRDIDGRKKGLENATKHIRSIEHNMNKLKRRIEDLNVTCNIWRKDEAAHTKRIKEYEEKLKEFES